MGEVGVTDNVPVDLVGGMGGAFDRRGVSRVYVPAVSTEFKKRETAWGEGNASSSAAVARRLGK